MWSNYTDSHRRIKVSASLCGATPLMRQPPIIETRHPPRGTSSGVPLTPTDGSYLLLVHRSMFFFIVNFVIPTLPHFINGSAGSAHCCRYKLPDFFPHIGRTNNPSNSIFLNNVTLSEVYLSKRDVFLFILLNCWMTSWLICISIFTTCVSLTVCH